MRDRTQQIIDELNELCAEENDVGEAFIDVVIDARADEGLPPLTPEELIEEQKQCDKNAAHMIAIEDRICELYDEYFFLTGKCPIGIGDIIYRYREPFAWE